LQEAAVFTNEADFRRWFEAHLTHFGIREIILSQEVCPVYVVVMEDGRPAKVEAELFAVSFRYHRHDPAKVDFIAACYSRSETVEGVPVKAVHRLWGFDAEPPEPILPDAPLSDGEASLLSAIHGSGGISLSALSEGNLGDQEIRLRLAPEKIASIPRGRIPDTLSISSRSPPKSGSRNIITSSSVSGFRTMAAGCSSPCSGGVSFDIGQSR
jgi:hypothetical protein